MLDSSPSENFDSYISEKDFCKPGKDQNVFSELIFAIPSGTTLTVQSLQLESKHATPNQYESVIEEQIFCLYETVISSRQFSSDVFKQCTGGT